MKSPAESVDSNTVLNSIDVRWKHKEMAEPKIYIAIGDYYSKKCIYKEREIVVFAIILTAHYFETILTM